MVFTGLLRWSYSMVSNIKKINPESHTNLVFRRFSLSLVSPNLFARLPWTDSLSRRTGWLAGMLILVLLLFSAGGYNKAKAQEQVYPDRPITIVVPFGVGGSADRMTRTMSNFLADALGQAGKCH